MTARRSVRRALVPLAAGLTISLAGCGGGGSTASSADNAKLDAMSMSQLAKEAAKEGSVTWYTTFTQDDVQPMIAAFNKVYPDIKVNALRLSADKIPARIMTEQRGGKYNADVVSGDSPQVAQLLEAGALQPYTPTTAAKLPAGLSLPKGYEGVIYALGTAIVYNPTVVKEKGLPVPTTWEDLTKPAWKGKFSIDPEAINWYDALIHSMGHAKALDLVKRLGANDPVFVESHTQAITDVQAGEPAATATGYGYKAAELAEKTPSRLAFVNTNPLPTSLNLVDVVKGAPHPAAARLFEDWIVSKQGQQEVIDVTNHTSIRTDVKNDPKVWNESKWKNVYGDPVLKPSVYNSELSELKGALGAP